MDSPVDFVACPLAWFRLKAGRCHDAHWPLCVLAWAILFTFLLGAITFAICNRMPWPLWLALHA